MNNKITKSKAKLFCILIVVLMGIWGFFIGKLKHGQVSSAFMLVGAVLIMIGLVIIVIDKMEDNKH